MCSLVTHGVEYSTPSHPADEMVWNIPHHSVRGEAAGPSTTECYVGPIPRGVHIFQRCVLVSQIKPKIIVF